MNFADDDDQLDPLQQGGASLPPVLGAGCAARFDPDALDDNLGTDFAAAAQWARDQLPE